jgi:hypothetical protein
MIITLTPGLVILGAAQSVSLFVAGTAGVAGATGVGFLTQAFMEETAVETNYHDVLVFLVHELSKIWESSAKVFAHKDFQVLLTFCSKPIILHS